ncbi:Fatty acid amide hydrolase [Escovopsis weberi]|uniref:Fatty acid amide hydrolase n=1 Tax=Escovopsis weberi TaxID=150374 RepID=A0A0M8MTZ7_ESCWE|nr:Fatty acid amide hydrolase [Escovopsis weberi]
MAPPRNFANYPDPVEGPDTGYTEREDHNPVLRGLPLVLGASLISNVKFVARYFWRNGRMGTTKDIPDLRDMPPTFHPCVTPLGENAPMLDLSPDLLSAKYTDPKARYYSISDYHVLYKSGKATPRDVVVALLDLTTKSDEYGGAWADYHGAESLVLLAADASTARWAAGKPLGIMDGVPIGVKDDTDVQGFVNHAGMKYRPDVPCFAAREESCWPVRALQDAGAIVIGKNKMHEIGSDLSGLNVNQGTPVNHHNKLYYPGGSSNGAGSSISAGVVPFAVCTDSGGSIRIPASYNGVYGLKPSHHRTMVMASTSCIVGPMAANVADLTIAYRFMSQPDPDCSTQSLFALSIPPEPSAKRYLGVYRSWFDIADPRTRETCDRALGYFASKRGYEVVDITIPYLSEAQVAHAGICMTEMAEQARTRTADPADWLSLVGAPNKLFLSVGAETPARDFLKYNSMRTLMMRHLAFLFRKYPGLLIVTPATPAIGWPKAAGDEAHGVNDSNRTLRSMAFIFLANLTGTPSVSAPVGYVDPDQGEGKMPVSLLATGEWGSEEQLLAWAAEAEEYLHTEYDEGRKRPESWVDVFGLAAQKSDS